MTSMVRIPWSIFRRSRVAASYHFRGTHFAARFLATHARREIDRGWLGDGRGGSHGRRLNPHKFDEFKWCVRSFRIA